MTQLWTMSKLQNEQEFSASSEVLDKHNGNFKSSHGGFYIDATDEFMDTLCITKEISCPVLLESSAR
jgi:hypothetical protein